MDDAQLRTIWQQRQQQFQATFVSEPLGLFMKQKLAKRVRQIGELAAIWDDLLPEDIRRHTALDGLQRGVLTVLVDNASQRFHLQTLLTGGLMRELQSRFSGSIQKVRLVPGQFYSVDVETGEKRYEF
jgi:hypothetical protein